MTSRFLTVLFLLAVSPFVRGADDDDDDDLDDDIDIDDSFEGGDDIDLENLEDDMVVALTASSFDAHIKENKFTMVKFYAPWCGHCKKLEPAYKSAAKILKKTSGTILAKVDATEEESIATKYDVEGYPTLLWFEDGEHVKFDGDKSEDGIIEWNAKMTGDAVLTAEDFPVAAGLVPMIVLQAPKLLPAFEKAAKKNRRSAEWHFMKSKGNAKAKVELQHIMDDPVIFEGDANNADELGRFAKDNALSAFGHIDSSSFGHYIGTHKGLIWTLFNESDIYETRRPMMTEVGKAFQSKYWVSYTHIADEALMGGIKLMLGVDKFPAIAVTPTPGEKKRFVYFGEMTAAKITEWINDVDAGKVQPYMRTEDEPKDDGSLVKQLVATNYEKEVFDKTKDTVIFVTAADCEPCDEFKKDWAKLSKMVTEDYSSFLKLATLNGTMNESPVEDFEWGVRGYPLIYLVKAGEREHKLHEEQRNFKDVWEFLRLNATQADEISKISAKRKHHTEL